MDEQQEKIRMSGKLTEMEYQAIVLYAGTSTHKNAKKSLEKYLKEKNITLEEFLGEIRGDFI